MLWSIHIFVEFSHLSSKAGFLYGGPLPSFLKYVNTQTLHMKNSIAVFPCKPDTLAGFEPGSSVPDSDAMSTAPRRQGCVQVSY
jgi:hypothetical protein